VGVGPITPSLGQNFFAFKSYTDYKKKKKKKTIVNSYYKTYDPYMQNNCLPFYRVVIDKKTKERIFLLFVKITCCTI
jgi:hypothetical protein